MITTVAVNLAILMALVILVVAIVAVPYVFLKLHRDLRLEETRREIERLERELDLDDTLKVKQPRPPKPMKIVR